MKQKTIVLIILIFLATASSVVVLASDGYLNKRRNESKLLSAVENSVGTPIALAKDTTTAQKPAIAKSTTTVKKAPAKKVVKKATPKKKKVVRKVKHKLNLAPAVFTPETAPYSAKR